MLYDLSITGAQVVEALENGVSQVEDGAGRFPQVGGIRFAFDANRPAGSRVSNVRVGSQAAGFSPIEPGRTYRIVTNDFMAGGGDGYAVFTRGSESLNSGLLLADVLMDYFTTTPSVSYAEDGRIEAIGRQVQILSSVSPANIIAIDDLWTPGEGLISLHRPVWAF